MQQPGSPLLRWPKMSEPKSERLGKLDDDEVMRVNPRTGTIQKSNAKVTTAMHQTAMSAGAVEIPLSSVMYKHAGKMYMFDMQLQLTIKLPSISSSQFDND